MLWLDDPTVLGCILATFRIRIVRSGKILPEMNIDSKKLPSSTSSGLLLLGYTKIVNLRDSRIRYFAGLLVLMYYCFVVRAVRQFRTKGFLIAV